MRDTQMLFQYDNGIIKTQYDVYINQPAILIDDTGVLLKYGDYDKVKAYHDKKLSKFQAAKIPVKIVQFDIYDNLSLDDVCSIMNYASNCTNEQLIKVLDCTDQMELRTWVDKIKTWGF